MDYRKKDEFMECIFKCAEEPENFDCFVNCDRFFYNLSLTAGFFNVELFSGSQLAPLQQQSSGSSMVGCRLDSPACTLRLWPRLKLLLFKSSMSWTGNPLPAAVNKFYWNIFLEFLP